MSHPRAPSDADTAELLALMDRLHTACLTVACLPADGPKGLYSLWPRYKLVWWDAEEHGAYRTDAAITAGLIAPPPFTPTPAQVDDCLPALALLDGLPSLNRRILSMRAHQLWAGRESWRRIARHVGLSHPQKALRIHKDTVEHAFRANHATYQLNPCAA